MNQNELYHYGVKGMKWKNHKYQKIVNGEYVYRTPAEQRLYNARKNSKEAWDDYEYKQDVYLHSMGNPYYSLDDTLYKKKAKEDAQRKWSKSFRKEQKAIERYKKSPMRNMKIAARVGKARATNIIRNIKGEHYVNPRLQNREPVKPKPKPSVSSESTNNRPTGRKKYTSSGGTGVNRRKQVGKTSNIIPASKPYSSYSGMADYYGYEDKSAKSAKKRKKK